MHTLATAVAAATALGLALLPSAAWADSHRHEDTPREYSTDGHAESDDVISGLMMPIMNPARGRILYASKGCVACQRRRLRQRRGSL